MEKLSGLLQLKKHIMAWTIKKGTSNIEVPLQFFIKFFAAGYGRLQ